MSADLWAAFGVEQSATAPENPENHEHSRGIIKNTTTSTLDSPASYQPRPRDLVTIPTRHNQDKPLWEKDAEGTDVLFDASASETDDEDEFGAFEEPEPAAVVAKPTSTSEFLVDTDLLGLGDLSLQSEQYPRGPEQISSGLVEFEPRVKPVNNPAAFFPNQNSSPAIEESAEDDWGEFEDLEPRQERAPDTAAEPQHEAEEDRWDAFEDGDLEESVQQANISQTNTNQPQHTASAVVPSDAQQYSHDRPTNIPPPFSLLQLLPTVYQFLSSEARSTSSVATIKLSVLGRLVLQAYCVTARIISGRSFRWKRDTILAQSMRIGEAGIKHSGMKLTVLNRGETIKEDQYVIEVINSWSRHAHVLNSVMAKAKVSRPPISLSESMKIRATSGPDVLTALTICPICGLKRNERVLGIDVNIQDTFGEFWVDHWGHKDCYDFWYRFKTLLSSRYE